MDWSKFPEYDNFILTASGSTPQIAEAFVERYGLPVTDDQVRSRLRRLRLEGETRPEPDEGMARFQEAVLKERQRTVDLAYAREMASLVKGAARWQEFLDLVAGEFARRPAREYEAALPLASVSGTPETYVLLMSDIHVGKFVDSTVVGPSFGYSATVFRERMATLLSRVLRYYQLHVTKTPFEAFRIYFLGDGVDGVDMRRGHAHRVDIQTATQQVLVCVEAFEFFLRSLYEQTGRPIEVIWDFGNHGRVGEFGVNLPADNWDFVIGTMLQIATRDDPNVTIDVRPTKYHLTSLGPYTVYSSHGDAIRGGDGFAGLPINGLARALAKDVGLHRQLIDLYLTAHFHTPQDIRTQAGRIIQNGAWDGGDDYSINQLKAAADPVQLAFSVHPRRGITWMAELELAPRREPTPVRGSFNGEGS